MDIIDALNDYEAFGVHPDICDQAVEEIERLRALAKFYENETHRFEDVMCDQQVEIERLRAEIKAMREQDWDALISARLAAQKAARGG